LLTCGQVTDDRPSAADVFLDQLVSAEILRGDRSITATLSVQGRLARMPTRGDLAKTALGIIISTVALVILWAEAFWHL
jgi:hypothetical protein